MRMTYLKNGETLALDPSLCTGCGKCIEVCPHAVFAMNAGKSEIVDRDTCMECGACARNCAFGAVTVKAGVGCAAAIIGGILRGKEPTCGAECGCSGAESPEDTAAARGAPGGARWQKLRARGVKPIPIKTTARKGCC